MSKLLFALPVLALGACGDNLVGNDPADTPIPAVTPACEQRTGDLQSFMAPDDFGPAVEGTLAGWDPSGRWFLTGTRVGGVSSYHFEVREDRLIVDRDEDNPGTADDTALFQRGLYADKDGQPFLIAKRVSNLRVDGTARADRAVCNTEGCTVCTAKLVRAERHDNEGEGERLTLVGELFGAQWDRSAFTFNVRVAGTIAYLIRKDGLYIIETADPAHPVELKHWQRNGPGYSNDVKLVEANGKRYAIIADYPSDVVDVTVPADAHLVAQIPVEAHTLFTETRDGKTSVYFGGYDGTTAVFDVTNPEAPQRLGGYDAEASVVHDLMIDNGIAYLNAWEEGLHVVDLTNPAQPVVIGKWRHTRAGRCTSAGGPSRSTVTRATARISRSSTSTRPRRHS
jgi:hypothetical protein